MLLEIENLVREFRIPGRLPWRPRRLRAVDDVTLAVAEGETLALVGESGCGKSTIGRLVVGLLEPTSGTIRFEGRPLQPGRERARQVQIVFQDPFGSLNPQMDAGAIVAEPAVLHGLVRPRDAGERARELLAMVGLPSEARERYPHEFSGGQRQRIAIARALAAEPRLIVCDEAVSALDLSVQAQITNLLQEIQKRTGVAYLFISHGLSLVHHISHRVAVMYLGQVVECGPVEQLFARPRHPYTRALISATPEPSPTARRERIVLQGEVPSPIDPPAGCRFHTRCPHSTALCGEKTPALEASAGSLVACHHWRNLPQAEPRQAQAADRVKQVIALYREAATARRASA